jgi:glucose-6-phosphate 1-dehydrogenase
VRGEFRGYRDEPGVSKDSKTETFAALKLEVESVCLSRELLASRHPAADEMDAYERVLGDAMAGDSTLFAREDYVEEAWRIVDPVLKAVTPVYEYEPKTWGPGEVDQRVTPDGGSQTQF